MGFKWLTEMPKNAQLLTSAAFSEPLHSVMVVDFSLLWITQNLVGQTDFFKLKDVIK